MLRFKNHSQFCKRADNLNNNETDDPALGGQVMEINYDFES
jgi:hypothetical protein